MISQWISADPAFEKYLPTGKQLFFPEDKFDFRSLPGIGGVYNSVNLNVYHYAGQNPVKLVDPDGKWLNPSAAFNYDFGSDYGSEAMKNFSEGNIGQGLLNLAAGTSEAGYNLLGVYGAASVFSKLIPIAGVSLSNPQISKKFSKEALKGTADLMNAFSEGAKKGDYSGIKNAKKIVSDILKSKGGKDVVREIRNIVSKLLPNAPGPKERAILRNIQEMTNDAAMRPK